MLQRTWRSCAGGRRSRAWSPTALWTRLKSLTWAHEVAACSDVLKPHECAAEDLEELRRREKEQGVEPDWTVDAFQKACAIEAKRETILTDFALHWLGLDVSAQPITAALIQWASSVRKCTAGMRSAHKPGNHKCVPSRPSARPYTPALRWLHCMSLNVPWLGMRGSAVTCVAYLHSGVHVCVCVCVCVCVTIAGDVLSCGQGFAPASKSLALHDEAAHPAMPAGVAVLQMRA